MEPLPVQPPQPAAAPRSKRRLFLAVAILVALGLTAWLMFRPDDGLRFSFLAPAQAAVGSEVAVSLELNSEGATVTAANLSIGYDADLLELINVQPGSLLGTVLMPARSEGGRMTVALGSGTTPGKGPGSIVGLRFRTLAPGEASVSLDPASAIAGFGPDSILTAVQPAVITVR